MLPLYARLDSTTALELVIRKDDGCVDSYFTKTVLGRGNKTSVVTLTRPQAATFLRYLRRSGVELTRFR